MQHGRVFLAGDAAHLITPAGGKGMNIAIQDAVELASGLTDRYSDQNDGRRLSSYRGHGSHQPFAGRGILVSLPESFGERGAARDTSRTPEDPLGGH